MMSLTQLLHFCKRHWPSTAVGVITPVGIERLLWHFEYLDEEERAMKLIEAELRKAEKTGESIEEIRRRVLRKVRERVIGLTIRDIAPVTLTGLLALLLVERPEVRAWAFSTIITSLVYGPLAFKMRYDDVKVYVETYLREKVKKS